MHVELFFASCDVVHLLNNFLEPIMHIISMKFQSVYPLLYYEKLHRFTANITRCLQACRVVFFCCDVVHPLHNFLDPIMHIISLIFQSVYPLLYYEKLKLFCTG